jgi:hypothetical protein
MDSHSDELQPNPLPADDRESGNDGERPMRVRHLEHSNFLLINGICRICQHELIHQDKLMEIYSDFGLIQTWDQPYLNWSIKWA